MSPRPPSDTALRVADLRPNGDHSFDIQLSKPALDALARDLELTAIRKLSFAGALNPLGKTDWRLSAKLGATVVQPCVVTLDPVTTRIDVVVERTYLAAYEDPQEEEVEITDEDSVEPLGVWIDPAQVMQEALVLAAPDYPRSPEAQTGELIFTKPGDAPMTDADARPFAGLAGFKEQLESDD